MADQGAGASGPVVAAVDVGSNTIKMTVAGWDGRSLVERYVDARTVRLSAGIEQNGAIAPEREEAALACLADFAAAARHADATVFIGVATEVLRVATNGAAFLGRVEAETPWRLDIISGDEEATLTFEGARAEVADVTTAIIADVGGASTELIAVVAGKAGEFVSLPTGSGRLSDRYISNDPPSSKETAHCGEAATAVFRESRFSAPAPLRRLLVTGGTGIYLGALVGGEARFPPERVAGAMKTLRGFPSAVLSDVLHIPVERARVLPAGVAVVEAMIALWSPAEIAVTESGVRRGLLMRFFSERVGK